MPTYEEYRETLNTAMNLLSNTQINVQEKPLVMGLLETLRDSEASYRGTISDSVTIPAAAVTQHLPLAGGEGNSMYDVFVHFFWSIARPFPYAIAPMVFLGIVLVPLLVYLYRMVILPRRGSPVPTGKRVHRVVMFVAGIWVLWSIFAFDIFREGAIHKFEFSHAVGILLYWHVLTLLAVGAWEFWGKKRAE